MDTLLQILERRSIPTAFAVKMFLLLFVSASFASNDRPAPTAPSKVKAVKYKIKATNKKRIIQTDTNALPVPSINYGGGPFRFTVGEAIGPLSAVSANVSPFGYDTVSTNVGSGLKEPFSIAVDTADNIYSNSFDHGLLINRIYKINAQDGSKTELPWNKLNAPLLVTDHIGNLYAAVGSGDKVLKYTGGAGTPEEISTGNVNRISGITIDIYGNIYLGSYDGGIYKMPVGGGKAVLVSTIKTNYPLGLAVDGENNVYASYPNVDKVYKIPADGSPEVEIGTGFDLPAGMVLDAAGNLYVVDYNNALLRMIPAGSQQTAVTLAKTIPYAVGLARDQSGSLYVVSQNHQSVIKYNPTGGYFADKLLPGGLKLDNHTGTISGTPSRLTPATNYEITAWNGNGSSSTTVNIATPLPFRGPFTFTVSKPISPIPGIPAAVSPFGYSGTKKVVGPRIKIPTSVVVDTAGNVYTASIDTIANAFKIIKISALDSSTTELPGHYPQMTWLLADRSGNIYASYDKQVLKYTGGSGTPEHFVDAPRSITSMAIDNYGNIYIGTLSRGGIFKVAAGTDKPVLISTDYIQPYGMAVDPDNNIYVSSRTENKVYKIPADGGPAVQIGTGFSLPMGLVLDATGNLFVNDTGNGYLKMVPANNQQTTVTIAAGLTEPYSLALDRSGSLYVADAEDTAILKYSPAGGYFGDRLLPGGLKLDNQTGAISGTPTMPHPATDYKITAWNTFGEFNSTTINIGVDVLRPSLSNLLVSEGALTPAFHADTLNYTASVDSEVTSIAVTPFLVDASATIIINDSTVVSGTPAAIPLAGGLNKIKVKVTSQDSTVTRSYTIMVLRTSADLQRLVVSGHTLSSEFKSSKTNYTVSTLQGAIKMRATTIDPTATITINGEPITSGVLTSDISLNPGQNTFIIVVTTVDGVTKTYTLKAGRGSNESRISTIVFNPTATMQAESAATLSYKVSVTADATQIKLKPTPRDKNASITVNGVAIANGTNTPFIPLNATGTTPINVLVTAEDGITVSNYTIIVFKDGSNNAGLKRIDLSKNATVVKTGTTGNTTNYTASVDASGTGLMVKPTAEDKNATIWVNGTIVKSGSNSGTIALTGNPTIVNITVTAEDGITTRYYSLAIYKNGSNNVKLKSLTLETPATGVTAESGTVYSASTGSTTATVRIRPTAENSGSTIKVDGMTIASGKSIQVNLSSGSNTFGIEVTAQDGITKQTYILNINRSTTGMFAVESPGDAAFNRNMSAVVTVNRALSPNGDGINDILTITGIAAYPENTLQVMNSKGAQVISISGYDNIAKVFDGRNQSGVLQSAGTYFYLLQYKDGTEIKTTTGYIVLKY